jgi:hypothetical protein
MLVFKFNVEKVVYMIRDLRINIMLKEIFVGFRLKKNKYNTKKIATNCTLLCLNPIEKLK